MTAAVRLADVRFRYEDMEMCFDLEVGAGELVAVIGPSGSGKSTLLNLIAGFEQPLSGRILIGGEDMTGRAPADRPVASLFQDHNLFSHLDAAANVGLGLSPGLRLTAEDRQTVAVALARVGLAGLEQRLPAQLSGGERQRVALARSLVMRRPVLLLDEPFAALGPALREDMLELLLGLQRERGTTVLLVTHQPEEALRAAGHTAFLSNGRVIAKGPTAELLARNDLAELEAYLRG